MSMHVSWKMQIFVLYLILVEIESLNLNGFKNVYNKIKNKIVKKPDLKVSTTTENIQHLLIGKEFPNATEYDIRDEYAELWSQYYSCLNSQYDSIKSYRKIAPIARMVFEGTSVRLQCQICLSPTEQENDAHSKIEWVSKTSSAYQFQSVDLTENVMITPQDKSLVIYAIRKDQTGQYACKLGSALTPIFYITVTTDKDEPIRPVKPPSRASFVVESLRPAVDAVLLTYSLKLTTKWDEWSLCNRCNVVGKRFKYGICTLITVENTSEETDQISQVITKIKKRRTSEISLANIVRLFKDGIPCRSHILPDFFKENYQIKNRSSEIMSGFCLVDCPAQKIFQVRDEFGNVLEQANNSAGIYSMLQSIPNFITNVERRVLYRDVGDQLTLNCPGNLNVESVPVSWQIGSKNVIPKLLEDESNGRVYVSILNHITFTKLMLHDSNIYSCWQNDELVGTIRLVVTKEFKLTFDHHIMLISIIAIMSTFLFVCTRAFFGRKYATF